MSSNTDNTTKGWRDQISPEARAAAGMIRRMAVALTEGAFWRAVGHLLLDNATIETKDAEVFGTLGFYSRPKPGANAEVIVLHPGGSANPVIVGTRDEDLRKAYDSLIAQGASLMCNRAVIVLCKADGTVEIRTPGGAAAALVPLSELNRLKTAIQGWAPVANDGGAALKTALTTLFSTWPVGTTVLKAQ